MISQLFAYVCIDAIRFFSIEIAILACESCRICHNPTDSILRMTAEEAKVTVPSFTEFMVYTKVKLTTCFRFQIAVPVKTIEQLVWCRSQEVLFIRSIHICFCIYIIAKADRWRCMCTEGRVMVNADTRCYSPFRRKFPFILDIVRCVC